MATPTDEDRRAAADWASAQSADELPSWWPAIYDEMRANAFLAGIAYERGRAERAAVPPTPDKTFEMLCPDCGKRIGYHADECGGQCRWPGAMGDAAPSATGATDAEPAHYWINAKASDAWEIVGPDGLVEKTVSRDDDEGESYSEACGIVIELNNMLQGAPVAPPPGTPAVPPPTFVAQAIARAARFIERDVPEKSALALEQVEVRAIIETRLGKLQDVRQIDEAWSRAVQDGEAEFVPQLATDLYGFYQGWYDTFSDVDKRVRALKEKGRNVLGAGDHRCARDEVHAILRSISLQDLLAEYK